MKWRERGELGADNVKCLFEFEQDCGNELFGTFFANKRGLVEKGTRRNWPKHGVLHGGCSDFSDDLSGEEYLPAPIPRRPTQSSETDVDSAPVTTAVLKRLLTDLQNNILQDVTSLWGDLKGLTGHISTLESASTTNSQDIGDLHKAVNDLKFKQQKLDQRLADQEDTKRQNNLKVRGIAETITEAELPQVITHLLTNILAPTQAKHIILDNLFRIPKSANLSYKRRDSHLLQKPR
ncbi:Hypothetical predicted protein [Pelobates cultripes]|uniref:Uncharacterized protein n=1 Tax=Pelobates cultripes TaxID=61616 RepID=A0AAD1VKI8_PELCU|nr:Hypothetical predicted protein [Pelobates cultripes]